VKTTLKRGGVVVGSIGAAALVYRLLLRSPILNWGATNAEAHARLPGDELLEEADGVATRAITIEAPAWAVWPWIAQMGPAPRGGAYTYDWIENLLKLDMHSVDRVLPEYQHPKIGDALGYGKNRMRTERVEPQQVLATRSQDGNWVWSFILTEHERQHMTDQPKPLPAPVTNREDRHASHGARIPPHGTKDAPRNQAASREPRRPAGPTRPKTTRLNTTTGRDRIGAGQEPRPP
jgi:hypothetical protein